MDQLFQDQILNDIRFDAFKIAIRFINYELIPGEICEFGCYTGRSLAALTYCHQKYFESENEHNQKGIANRKIFGFDSFEGLTESENHPRWNKGLFNKNHSFHPTIKYGDSVTPDKVVNFFKQYKLMQPILIKSYFENLVLDDIKEIALIHIDCDLYSSTKIVLDKIKDKLVDGSLILFDDWYNFKGKDCKGERRAFKEFCLENRDLKCEEFLRYGTFCKAFIINK